VHPLPLGLVLLLHLALRNNMLSDSESEKDDVQLTINEHFAKAYAHRKEREELQKRPLSQCIDPI
jgi:hypothetical protein